MTAASEPLASIEARLLAALDDGDLPLADTLASERDALLRAILSDLDGDGLAELAHADRRLRAAVDKFRRGLAIELERVRIGRTAVSAYATTTASQ